MDYVIFLLNYIEIVRISSALTPYFLIHILKHFPFIFVRIVAFILPFSLQCVRKLKQIEKVVKLKKI